MGPLKQEKKVKKLRPEDFALYDGTEAGIPGLQVIIRLGHDPAKCEITVDEAGHLHIERQGGNVGLICAPGFWAYANKPE